MKLIPSIYIQQKMFGISTKEVNFVRRGFRSKRIETVKHLETVGKEFLRGYHLAINVEDTDSLVKGLNETEAKYRGFTFEGAAMNLALLDYLIPWRKKRLEKFIEGEGSKHIYMVYVGIGWAIARIPWLRKNILKSISKYDPLLKWLIIDGYGFHEGYFNAEKYFKRQINLEWLPKGYIRNVFAQGLGRCLWFVEGANVREISEIITRMPREFHADLWSGIGLACTYAGGATKEDIKDLKIFAGAFIPNLLQGVVFAAASRKQADNLVEHTETASQIICNMSAEDTASIAFSTMHNLPKDSDLDIPSYEIWRQKIRQELLSNKSNAAPAI